MRGVILISFLIPIFCFSQNEKQLSKVIKKKIIAKNTINNIKNNIILVRLSAKSNTISAMRSVGKNKLADKTEAKQLKRNKAIVSAFKTNFSFCPVYFFYSEDSKYVSNNKLDSVNFLTDSLLIDKNIRVSSNLFYVIDFGSLEPETNKGNLNKKGEEKYYPSSNITISALIIKDSQFTQLQKPFPYYVREFKGLPFKKSVSKMVVKLNEQLNSFYSKK